MSFVVGKVLVSKRRVLTSKTERLSSRLTQDTSALLRLSASSPKKTVLLHTDGYFKVAVG